MANGKNTASPNLGRVFWPCAWSAAIVSVGCAALIALIGWLIDGGFETTLITVGWLFSHLWTISLMALKAVSLGGESFWIPAIAALTLSPLVAAMFCASIKLFQAQHNTDALRMQNWTFCLAIASAFFSGSAIYACGPTDNISASQRVVAVALVGLLTLTASLIVFGLPMLIDQTRDRLKQQRFQHNEINT